MVVEFDHIALLVTDLEKTLETLNPDWHFGKIDTFPAEGTKEIYIGPPNATGKLLLIEPIGAGPYQNALEKRGAGLHHIAINVPDCRAYADKIAGSGWYLHPSSLTTFHTYQTIWFARPATPLLIEVAQRKPLAQSDQVDFISKIEVPLPTHKPSLVSAVGLDQFQASVDSNFYITIDGSRVDIQDLLVT